MRLHLAHTMAVALSGIYSVVCSEEPHCAEQTFDAIELLQHSTHAQKASTAESFFPFSRDDMNQVLSDAGHDSKESWRLASEFAERNFEIQRIPSAEIAESMAYARAGSSIPSSLHGIFWLDQFHRSSIAKNDTYSAAKPFKHPPSDETLVSFGDAPTAFEPQSRCVGPVPGYGGVQGHWTYLDTTRGRLEFDGALSSRITADFCFDQSMQSIDVIAGVRVPILGWVFIPSWLGGMRMERRSWGWNRVNLLGPNISTTLEKFGPMLDKILPSFLMATIRSGDSGGSQYPVIQIIDGEGKKTEYFQEYMDYITGENNDFKPTQLVGKVSM